MLAGCVLLGTPSRAEVPGLITYQGHVSVSGTNYTGPGWFQFALVNPGLPEDILWTQDGLPKPKTIVSVAVTEGRFHVVLGDTSLDGMLLPVPASVFAHADVRLRVWFGTDPTSMVQLSPDQRFTAVGYALQAAGVSENAITSSMLAPEAVLASHLASGSVTGPKLAPGAVTGDRIADATITASKLAPGAVGSSQLSENVTFRQLDLGGADWDGVMRWFARREPEGGGGLVSPGGQLRGRLTATDPGSSLEFYDDLGRTALTLSSQGEPRIAFRRLDGTNAAFLGASGGAGQLLLHQQDGRPGVLVDGDRAAPENNANAGGVISLYQRTGFPSLFLSGDHENAGRIEIRQAGGLPFVDILGRGSNDGGELRVASIQGRTTVSLLGRGANDAGEARIHDASGRSTVEWLGQSGPDQSGQLRMRGSSGTTNVTLTAQTGASSGAHLLLANHLGRQRVSLDAQNLAGGGHLLLYNHEDRGTVQLNGDANANGGLITVHNGDGASRASVIGDLGNAAGGLALRGPNGTETVRLVAARPTAGPDDSGGQLFLSRADGTTGIELDAQAGTGGGWIGLRKPSEDSPSIILHASAPGGARVTTQVLEITGGSDLSEGFDIVASNTEPGMIVSIDSVHPGKLTVSRSAYDTAVAGVVSGAGGVRPGLIMGQQRSVADGQHPVALSGRVYCLVDARYGAVRPGDLITTSDTPGHGMRAGDATRSQGAILGKAMTPLAEGRGLVLVLVNLH